MSRYKEIPLPGMRRLILTIGEIQYQPVEAIVNAANGGLSHGGGVAAAISDAAGRAFDGECRQRVRTKGRVPTGEAVVTGAGKLPFRGVIHAVGPQLGDGDEEAKLTRAIANALLRAHERGWRSIAFPAISSGIYAVPKETCARAYVAGVEDHLKAHPDSTLKEIRICLFLGKLVDLVAGEMDRLAKPKEAPQEASVRLARQAPDRRAGSRQNSPPPIGASLSTLARKETETYSPAIKAVAFQRPRKPGSKKESI